MTTNHLLFSNGAIGTRVSVAKARSQLGTARIAALAKHQKASRDYDLLLKMSDRMLDDIGLERSISGKVQLQHQLWPWGKYG
jgi:uncharacterized protein YjiS (DUF1127 family)